MQEAQAPAAPASAGYFSHAKQISYNFIVAGILVLLYQFFLMFAPAEQQVLNAVHVLLKKVMDLFPNGAIYINGLVVLGGAIMIFLDYKKGVQIKASHIGMMIGEALVWGIVIYFNLNVIVGAITGGALANSAGTELAKPSFLQEIGLSFGAGFYEELFFRLLLVKLLQLGFLTMLKDPTFLPNAMVIVSITATMFSAAHLSIVIGEYGEPFDLYVFIYRFVFGVAMSALLVLRGFAITAWTHAWYDVLVFSVRAMA